MGIDPGLQRTGWGIIEKSGASIGYVDCGVIQTDPEQSLALRLKTIHEGMVEIIRQYQPQTVAVEETFVSINGASTLKLGQARGAIMLTLAICGLDIFEYSATNIKKAVTGAGRAEKKQVEALVRILLPPVKSSRADAYDALAAAICHANSVRL